MKNKAIPKLRFRRFDSEWSPVKLVNISKHQIGGGTPSTKNKKYWNGTIPWIRSSNLEEDDLLNIYPERHINNLALENTSTKLIPKDSIALVTRVGVGKIAYIPYEYATSQDFLSFSQIRYYPYFILYALYLLINKEKQKLQGTSIKGITKKYLLGLRMNIPESSEEQQLIGKFFAKLDKLIQLQQKKVALLKKLKRGYLQKLFPRKGEMVPRIRFKGFCDKWKQVTINSISNYKNGHSLEKLAVSTHNNSAKVIVDLNSISIDGTLKDSGKRLPNDFKNTLNKNDLVMILSDLAHGNLIGLTAIIPKNNTYALNQRVGLLRFNKDINSIFMHYLLNSIQRYFHRMSAGTSQLNLSKKDILQTKLLIPSLDEQTKISNFLNYLDSNISIHRDNLNCFRKLKKAYLQKMFC